MLVSRFHPWFLVLAAACAPSLGSGDKSDGGSVEDDPVKDADGDGFAADVDCDDGTPDIAPGATERPNGVDDDCDGVVDDGTVAFDDDGDGFTEQEGDCDDAAFEVSPDADEVPNDRDDDCNDLVDDGTIRFDDDGDGWSEDDGDCDDTRAGVHNGVTETANNRDDDCDGIVDEGTTNFDDDGDAWSEVEGDCNDSDPAVNPGIAEFDFSLLRLDMYYDPTDFAGESWDWDGGGLSDFYAKNASWVDLLGELALEGQYSAEAMEELLPVVEDALGWLLSSYVSPDITVTPYRWDGRQWVERSSYVNDEDDLVVLFPPVTSSFTGIDEGVFFDGVDRDVAFDDPMGGIYLGVEDYRYFAGCGVQWIVFSDADMDSMETRVRLIAVEVERR